MAAFARPLPGLAFFELVLHAPADEVAEHQRDGDRGVDARPTPTGAGLARACTGGSSSSSPPGATRARAAATWSTPCSPPRSTASRSPTRTIIGVIQLLILGGLETTAGALGQFMIRFCQRARDPRPAARASPSCIPGAVEELLRLDPPFIAIARTAIRDTEIGGQPIEAGRARS